ncbi:MAG TPA: DUF3891 family protein [Thermoanaerobaculia bacterium]|nr:DUF3891 family protein [Thermoanaerobaculia bacterium]
MIVHKEGQTLLFVTQPDHAHFAGELLTLWRADHLPENPRRPALLFAAREHDNGWREADAAPRWDGTRGCPHDFISMPSADRIEIWQRGTARFAASEPYATLLITRHAQTLNRERREQPEWQEFFVYLDELERGLRAATAATAASLEEVSADYRLLDLADLSSLAVCNRWATPFERHGVRGRFSAAAGTLHLDPFPLAGATAFNLPYRRIPDRPYRGDADLGGELAAARWEEMRVRVAP